MKFKYVALKPLSYSQGGPGHFDENGNWQGDYVAPGEDVSVTHLTDAKIQLLRAMGAIIEMPEIEVKKPAKAKPENPTVDTQEEK